jgi:TIR domain/Tetratricopeptide repeat
VAGYDVFVSYRRKHTERVLPLVEALRRCDLAIWFDQSEISDFAPITDEIRNGLAASKALLAWYSKDYPQSRPCQMELTAAFIAAQRDGDPRRRMLVVNPEPDAMHIEPVELRDEQHASAPVGLAEYDTLAARIAAHVRQLATPLGAILPITPPPQYGQKLAGASRFVGRLRDIWRVHSALHESESAIITGASWSGLAQVTGLGGVGKSLLAEEYAVRFGAAFPGGIFWLRALGNDADHPPGTVEEREASRGDQFRSLAIALGIPVRGREPPEVESALAHKLGAVEKPFLWIVDDLASGLDADAVRAWLAPHPLGKTLLTTRSREYGAIGRALPLDVLEPAEAYALLTAARQPDNPDEEVVARSIAEDVGYHPLALAVAAASLDAQAGLRSFADFGAALADHTKDELELAADLADMLPTGHQKSVASTLLRSVRALPPEGMDFLRLASLLAVAPIPPTLVAAVFADVYDLGEAEAKHRAALALKQAERASLSERAERGARTVHALVSRAVRFHHADPARCEQLRVAIVAALRAALPKVADIRLHEKLALEVMHARALCVQGFEDVEMARLALWVAHYDFERGAYPTARALQEEVVQVTRRVLGAEHPNTLTAMSNLAQSLSAQGDMAGARALQEEPSLPMRVRQLGSNSLL